MEQDAEQERCDELVRKLLDCLNLRSDEGIRRTIEEIDVFINIPDTAFTF